MQLIQDKDFANVTHDLWFCKHCGALIERGTELRGDKILFKNVSPHRRSIYKYGEIPNKFAEDHCGGPVLLLTCAADVHKYSLKVAVMGWCRERRPFLIEYHNFEGKPEYVDDTSTWGKLSDLIENREYKADDGKRYRIEATLVDCGYLTDQVYGFCAQYKSGIYPVKGQALSDKSVRVPEFSTYTTPNGINAYGITVDLYKDRYDKKNEAAVQSRIDEAVEEARVEERSKKGFPEVGEGPQRTSVFDIPQEDRLEDEDSRVGAAVNALKEHQSGKRELRPTF